MTKLMKQHENWNIRLQNKQQQKFSYQKAVLVDICSSKLY
jgi:hypothetical protein